VHKPASPHYDSASQPRGGACRRPPDEDITFDEGYEISVDDFYERAIAAR
jgi:hypothetical protein